jgi:hypothetical protein
MEEKKEDNGQTQKDNHHKEHSDTKSYGDNKEHKKSHKSHNDAQPEHKVHRQHPAYKKFHDDGKVDNKLFARHKTSKKLNMDNIFVSLAILLGIVILINIFVTFNFNKEINDKYEEAMEANKPAQISLTVIKDSDCDECFDITSVVDFVKESDLNITFETTLEFDSDEAKELIQKFRIEKIPAMIVEGDTEKTNLQGLDKVDGALVLKAINPPYTDPSDGRIKGLVTMYLLKDFSCDACNDLKLLKSQIKGTGVITSEELTLDINSAKGKSMIEKYGIEFAPSLILSNEAASYEVINEAWKQVGSIEGDGSFVLRTVTPPFINLSTGKLNGLVDVIYLTDKSCEECYDVNAHRKIIANPQSFAFNINSEEAYDVSDSIGKDILEKYDVTKVPTVILSEGVSAYPSSRALSQFFSVEDDGSYIFRNLDVMGTYNDLELGEVIYPKQAGAQ